MEKYTAVKSIDAASLNSRSPSVISMPCSDINGNYIESSSSSGGLSPGIETGLSPGIETLTFHTLRRNPTTKQNTKESFEQKRAYARKSNDPQVQFEFAK
jgi:hypothetical protein